MSIAEQVSHTLFRIAGRVPLVREVLFLYYCYVRREFDPPELFVYVGGGDFPQIGRALFEHMRDIGGVTPNDRVLDVGCGIGRVAIHFASFLKPEAVYEGFDVVKKGPTWCNWKIARRHPNFSFRYVDIYNKRYNPRGTIHAEEYVFPYDDGSFDFVFATSVFTHMLPDAVQRYLSEISRVMRSGGRCSISYFLMNETSKGHMPGSTFNFKCIDSRYGVLIEDNPEAAIAYEESFITTLYQDTGLQLLPPVLYGNWSGRPSKVGLQDIIVAQKL